MPVRSWVSPSKQPFGHRSVSTPASTMGQNPWLSKYAWASAVMSPIASAFAISAVHTVGGTLLQRGLTLGLVVLHMQTAALVGTGYVTGHVGVGSGGSPQPGATESVVPPSMAAKWHTCGFAYAVWATRPSNIVIAISCRILAPLIITNGCC